VENEQFQHVFDLNNPKNQLTGDDYDIFNKKQSKTETSKAFENPMQTPAIFDGPAEPETQDQILVMLTERLSLAVEQQQKTTIVGCV
jgi:hypothetical protein